MKRLFSMLISFALVFGMLPTAFVSAEGTELSGNGTAQSPYLITTAAELEKASEMVNDGTAKTAVFELTANIDYGNGEWAPIGSATNPFGGTFNGNGHTVSNLKITSSQSGFIYHKNGFFGQVENATLKNLMIDNMTIAVYNHKYKPVDGGEYRAMYIGGFVSDAKGAVIENCGIVNSSVRNLQCDLNDFGVGIFAGYIQTGTTVKNCYVYNGKVKSGYYSPEGGFAAKVVGTNISFENCYVAECAVDATGAVSQNGCTSALFGFGAKENTASITTAVSVTNCYTTVQDTPGTAGPNYTPYSYNAENSIISTTSDKSAIADALTTDANSVWETDDNVNDGYPYIDYTALPAETPAPTATPTVAPVTTPAATATSAPTATPTLAPVVNAWDGVAATSYGGGRGTVGSPYIIENAAQLAYARDRINAGTDADKHFKITKDIDGSSKNWYPIGTDGMPFKGTFDGGGHTVKNLVFAAVYPTTEDLYIGFFGTAAAGSVIKDLSIDNVKITAKNTSATRCQAMGAFIGKSGGKIETCSVKNSVAVLVTTGINDRYGSGGFAGYLTGGTEIRNCYVYNVGVRSGQVRVMGGFFCEAESCADGVTTTVENCYVGKLYVARLLTDSSKEANDSCVYGFGGTSADGVNITNCWSSYEDTYSKHTTDPASIKNETVDANKKGYTGRSKEDIAAEFADGSQYCIWAVSESINDGFPYHTYAKAPDPNDEICERVLEGLTVPERVYTAFKVPTSGDNGTVITWESADESLISFSGGEATVLRDANEDKQTVVAAVVSKGNSMAVKEFNVTVAMYVDTYVRCGEMQKTTNNDGTVKTTLDVSYSGINERYSTVSYMVVITDANGTIKYREKDEKSISLSSGDLKFEATVPALGEGETMKYYLWGDGNVSLLDNNPSDISGIKAESKAKYVKISWDPSYDDGGDAVSYEIYKDGKYVTTTKETVYSEYGSDTVESRYKIVPVDSNSNKGTDSTSDPVKRFKMFYCNPSGEYGLEKLASSGSDSYFVTKSFNVGGTDVTMYTSDVSTRQHYIYFAKDTLVCNVGYNDTDVVFEVDYYDKGTGSISLVYNSVFTGTDTVAASRKTKALPARTDTETIKTAVVKISDAMLRNSDLSSAASFGILVPNNTASKGIAIREIRVCRAEDYE